MDRRELYYKRAIELINSQIKDNKWD
jgi:hypothetical protein